MSVEEIISDKDLIEGLVKQNRDMEKTLSDMKEERERLRRSLSESQSESAKNATRANKAEKSVDSLSSQIHALKAERDSYKRELAKLEKQKNNYPASLPIEIEANFSGINFHIHIKK